MKTSKILIVLLISFHYGFSQKAIKYDYVVNGKSIGNRTEPFLGMEFEFSTVRRYNNNNEFKETRLFTGSNKDYIVYKIINHIWYYKDKDRWKLFYDFNNKHGGRIRLSNQNYRIVFDKEVNIRDQKLHKLSFKSIKIMTSHVPAYFFSPNEGIVIIKTPSGIILVRNDYIKDQLSENELDIL